MIAPATVAASMGQSGTWPRPTRAPTPITIAEPGMTAPTTGMASDKAARRTINPANAGCRPAKSRTGCTAVSSVVIMRSSGSRQESRFGEADDDLEPRPVVGEFQRGAVHLHHACDQAEAQSVAGRRAAALEPVKALKHPAPLAFGDSGTIVRARGERLPPPASFHAECDPRPDRGVVECVLDEVGEE